MHELAIADAVLNSVLRHAEGRAVVRVHLRVGHLRQVVPAALEFSWEIITRETAAEGAVLEIEPIATIGQCRACGEQTLQKAFPLQCGTCGGLDLDVLQGAELEVEWCDTGDTVTQRSQRSQRSQRTAANRPGRGT